MNASLQLQYHHQPFAYFDNYAPFDTTHTVPQAFVGGFAGTGASGLTPHQAGVTRALDIIRAEMDTTMALLGERDVRNIGAHNIYSNDLVPRHTN